MQFENPGLKQTEQQLLWVNSIVHSHDMLCKCNKPLEHAIDSIIDQEKNLRLPESTKKKLQKCLSTTVEDGDPPGNDDIIQEGDLDALFAENFTEEETG